MVTTTSITAVSVSTRSAQSTWSTPEVIQLARTGAEKEPPLSPTRKKVIQEKKQEMKSSEVVTISLARSPIRRPSRPATRKPRRGRKTIAEYMLSALHHIDVFDRDRAAVAEIGDDDG